MAAHWKIVRQGALRSVVKVKIVRQGVLRTVRVMKVVRQGVLRTFYVAGPAAPTSIALTDVSVCLGFPIYRVQVDVTGGGPQYKFYREGVLMATQSGTTWTDTSVPSSGTFQYDVYSWDGTTQSPTPASNVVFVGEPCP